MESLGLREEVKGKRQLQKLPERRPKSGDGAVAEGPEGGVAVESRERRYALKSNSSRNIYTLAARRVQRGGYREALAKDLLGGRFLVIYQQPKVLDKMQQFLSRASSCASTVPVPAVSHFHIWVCYQLDHPVTCGPEGHGSSSAAGEAIAASLTRSFPQSPTKPSGTLSP